jgi:hypothetical protein
MSHDPRSSISPSGEHRACASQSFYQLDPLWPVEGDERQMLCNRGIPSSVELQVCSPSAVERRALISLFSDRKPKTRRCRFPLRHEKKKKASPDRAAAARQRPSWRSLTTLLARDFQQAKLWSGPNRSSEPVVASFFPRGKLLFSIATTYHESGERRHAEQPHVDPAIGCINVK